MRVYTYRYLFKLSAREFAQEPIDQFFINEIIYADIEKKKEIISKNG